MNQERKPTLLVVDDEEDLRNAIAYHFRRIGFHVLTTDGGLRAIELVRSEDIDVVITDVRMPDGDGTELLTNIRAHHPTRPEVIIVTGWSDLTETDYYARGALKVISKPFDREELVSVVKKAVARMRAKG